MAFGARWRRPEVPSVPGDGALLCAVASGRRLRRSGGGGRRAPSLAQVREVSSFSFALHFHDSADLHVPQVFMFLPFKSEVAASGVGESSLLDFVGDRRLARTKWRCGGKQEDARPLPLVSLRLAVGTYVLGFSFYLVLSEACNRLVHFLGGAASSVPAFSLFIRGPAGDGRLLGALRTWKN